MIILKTSKMNKDDLNQLVTKQDLEKYKKELITFIDSKISPHKKFYKPTEFSEKTGIPYSSLIYKCTTGKIKAFQESPNCSWLIDASELERFNDLAEKNFDNDSNLSGRK